MFKQRPRDFYTVSAEQLRHVVTDLIKVAYDTKLPLKEVIMVAEMLERRRANDIATQDGDRKDDHIAELIAAIDANTAVIRKEK